MKRVRLSFGQGQLMLWILASSLLAVLVAIAVVGHPVASAVCRTKVFPDGDAEGLTS